jgi:hypothetical protein
MNMTDWDRIKVGAASMASSAAAVKVVLAVAEAIREAGEVPSGTLYAVLCGQMSIHTYETVVRTLRNAGLIEERMHLLRWIGPTFPKEVR